MTDTRNISETKETTITLIKQNKLALAKLAQRFALVPHKRQYGA